MKLILGSDHGGYQLKEDIKSFLGKKGIEVDDVGTATGDSRNRNRYPAPIAPGTTEAGA